MCRCSACRIGSRKNPRAPLKAESFWILRLAKHYPYHDVDNEFILHIRQLENGLERPRGVLARSKTQTQVANGVTKQSLPNLKKFDCAPMISSVSVVA